MSAVDSACRSWYPRTVVGILTVSTNTNNSRVRYEDRFHDA